MDKFERRLWEMRKKANVKPSQASVPAPEVTKLFSAADAVAMEYFESGRTESDMRVLKRANYYAVHESWKYIVERIDQADVASACVQMQSDGTSKR
ncbi:unnamed protein product, partial [Amoebophrya sp. A25]|eukprot:GSA25T00022382001.1